MEDNINTKINELLSSPDLINNVKNILSGITTNAETTEIISSESQTTKEISDIFQTVNQNTLINSISKFFSENQNERIALLTALRPFLNSEKQETIDLIIQILKAVNLFFSINRLT